MEQGPSSSRSPKLHSRTFSYRSDHSTGSKGSKREELVESPKEKERRDSFWKGGSKANPNAAINEAQPGDQAILEASTLSSLRAIQHTDTKGNVIVDPDLSNPTRPRMERPLDTIRSFENAIDQGYRRRTTSRSESYDQSAQSAQSRRGSYFGNYDNGPPANRYGAPNGGGYYGQRNDGYSSPGPSGPPRMRYGNRMQSDSQIYTQRAYPQYGYHQSQDTMNTGMTNGSDSTGPWANSTDPSSENSSVDRGPTANGYSNSGFQGTIPEEGGAYPMPGGAPPVQMPYNSARRPIPLGNSIGERGPPPPAHIPNPSRPEPEKRKSWLKRRFSKNP